MLGSRSAFGINVLGWLVSTYKSPSPFLSYASTSRNQHHGILYKEQPTLESKPELTFNFPQTALIHINIRIVHCVWCPILMEDANFCISSIIQPFTEWETLNANILSVRTLYRLLVLSWRYRDTHLKKLWIRSLNCFIKRCKLQPS